MNFSSFALPRDLVADFSAPHEHRGSIAPSCGVADELARATSQGSVGERNLALAIAIVSGIAGAVMAMPF